MFALLKHILYDLVAAWAAGGFFFGISNSLWLSALILVRNATLVVSKRVYVNLPPPQLAVLVL
jgi:hypothetical protein